MRHTAIAGIIAAIGWLPLPAQVTFERLLGAPREPQNWLTYNGNVHSTHYSALDQVNASNVANLDLKGVSQTNSLEKFEATPLVVDGVMYVTEPPNNAVAIDTRTGRPYWMYERPMPDATYVCCGNVNRGLAMLGDTLFMGTLDAHLVALDASSGRKKWETKVAEFTHGYSVTVAPLVVKDKVIVGPAGGERGISGFLAAYDSKTGKEVWRFNTIPHPGEPGNDTWSGDSWKTGGGSIWVTGSYDPELNLVYWGIGNPGPDWNADSRLGDDLYTCSLVALDGDTGALKWHFQFTPHDSHDWDSTHVPVLYEAEVRGVKRKLVAVANRNAFFYVLDRSSGEFITARAYAKQTWAKGLDDRG